jgi:hypothetical protein
MNIMNLVIKLYNAAFIRCFKPHLWHNSSAGLFQKKILIHVFLVIL